MCACLADRSLRAYTTAQKWGISVIEPAERSVAVTSGFVHELDLGRRDGPGPLLELYPAQLERNADSGDLEDVDAERVICDHLFDPAHLALDAVHASAQCDLVALSYLPVSMYTSVDHATALAGPSSPARRSPAPVHGLPPTAACHAVWAGRLSRRSTALTSIIPKSVPWPACSLTRTGPGTDRTGRRSTVDGTSTQEPSALPGPTASSGPKIQEVPSAGPGSAVELRREAGSKATVARFHAGSGPDGVYHDNSGCAYGQALRANGHSKPGKRGRRRCHWCAQHAA